MYAMNLIPILYNCEVLQESIYVYYACTCILNFYLKGLIDDGPEGPKHVAYMKINRCFAEYLNTY